MSPGRTVTSSGGAVDPSIASTPEVVETDDPADPDDPDDPDGNGPVEGVGGDDSTRCGGGG